MSLKQSYNIAHGGRYELGQHIDHIDRIRLVSVTVNGKLIRYTPLTHRESENQSRYYIEIGETFDPLVGGMLMVNKEERCIETFISSDRFFDSVVVTLEIN
jgi:hypothetical protein